MYSTYTYRTNIIKKIYKIVGIEYIKNEQVKTHGKLQTQNQQQNVGFRQALRSMLSLDFSIVRINSVQDWTLFI